ncbi:MAG: hypothetical protein SOT60_05440 [Bilifractor sp.]|nr:hypothetical protein [Lachnospiraceae bacterium]MDY2837361.1 hypothetical protein [Bilifractor sp.]
MQRALSHRNIQLFNKFPCIDINMPLQLFNDSLVERITNNIFSDIPEQAIHQARDKIKYWKYPKEKQSDMTCSLDEKVDQQINKNIERAEQIVCDYHKTINKDNFDAAWGNVCFFSKSYQKKVYDNLYRPLKDLVNSFNAEQWHLEMYCDGDNNNLPVVFNKCVELSTKLYNRQEINSDKDFQVRITSKLPLWYSGPLLNFWINTYHPNKAEIIEESKSYQEIEPVVCHITDKKGL